MNEPSSFPGRVLNLLAGDWLLIKLRRYNSAAINSAAIELVP